MAIMLIILIPYLLLAAAYFFSLRAVLRSHSPSRGLFLPSLLISLLLNLGFITWGFIEIDASTSSTSAIGYLVLPYMALIGAGISFLLVLAIGVILRFIAERAGWASVRLTSLPKLIGALLFLAMAGWAVQHNLARSRLLDTAMSESTDAATLESLLQSALETQDIELCSKLAGNPSTPIPDLVRLFNAYEDSVEDPFSTNYRLFRSLAENPRTPADILAALADSPFESVRLTVGINPSTQVEVLTRLVDDEDDLVRSYLSDNPNLPEPLRQQLKEQEFEEAASTPAQTPAP